MRKRQDIRKVKWIIVPWNNSVRELLYYWQVDPDGRGYWYHLWWDRRTFYWLAKKHKAHAEVVCDLWFSFSGAIVRKPRLHRAILSKYWRRCILAKIPRVGLFHKCPHCKGEF